MPPLATSTKVVMCFAFGNQTGDRERLCRMLDAMTRGPPAPPPIVVTVSLLPMTPRERRAHKPLLHQETNFFSCERGFVTSLRPDTTCMLLDYFWIAQGYFSSSYGMDWVSAKVPRAFAVCPRLRCFILPNDSTLAMAKMLQQDGEKLLLCSIAFHYLTWREARTLVPLVRATEEARPEELGQDFREQWKCVDASQPLIVFHRCTETWRAALGSLWA